MLNKSIKDLTVNDLFILFFALVASSITLQYAKNALNLYTNNTDKDGWHRSGVSIVHDYGTGMDYLKTPEGYITPRLGVMK